MLYFRFGAPEVMAGQMAYLAELAGLARPLRHTDGPLWRVSRHISGLDSVL